MSAEKLTFQSLGKLPVSDTMSKTHNLSEDNQSLTTSVGLSSTVPLMTTTDWKVPA